MRIIFVIRDREWGHIMNEFLASVIWKDESAIQFLGVLFEMTTERFQSIKLKIWICSKLVLPNKLIVIVGFLHESPQNFLLFLLISLQLSNSQRCFFLLEEGWRWSLLKLPHKCTFTVVVIGLAEWLLGVQDRRGMVLWVATHVKFCERAWLGQDALTCLQRLLVVVRVLVQNGLGSAYNGWLLLTPWVIIIILTAEDV